MIGTKDITAVQLIAPASVATSAATASSTTAVMGLEGPQAFVCSFAAAEGRTKLTLTVKGCDTSSGSFAELGKVETTSADAGVVRVDLGGEYLNAYIKAEITVAGAATVADCVMLQAGK